MFVIKSIVSFFTIETYLVMRALIKFVNYGGKVPVSHFFDSINFEYDITGDIPDIFSNSA